MLPKVGASSGSESPRVAIPLAICQVIDTLVDELGNLPDYRRAELRRIQSLIRTMYQLKVPKLDEIQLAQELAEEDGEAISDAP